MSTTQIQILPDLAWLMLQGRRALRPITQALQAKEIRYRWGYPFSLTASHQGVQSCITIVLDVPDFIKTFDLPQIEIQDWYDPLAQGAPEALPQRTRWREMAEKRRTPGKRLPYTPTSMPQPASRGT
ncbi:Hypothetical predicted protein [Pelobates cultripes]|uniref:Uncharacterized protein n=1 Tax=Pelobates cultripes TaxID=61616 RepID=A0AAD1S6A1_PELCU|nr:Hypothetical predicted protein [Pelobates cultripes]